MPVQKIQNSLPFAPPAHRKDVCCASLSRLPPGARRSCRAAQFVRSGGAAAARLPCRRCMHECRRTNTRLRACKGAPPPRLLTAPPPCAGNACACFLYRRVRSGRPSVGHGASMARAVSSLARKLLAGRSSLCPKTVRLHVTISSSSCRASVGQGIWHLAVGSTVPEP